MRRFCLALLLAFSACATTDADRVMDGASGPLTVDLVSFDVARLGQRAPIEYTAHFLISIANNSHDDVTVKKISMRQRGMTTIDLESPQAGFNKTIHGGLAEQFDVNGRARMKSDIHDIAQQIKLAVIVEVGLDNGDAYEYTFDVPVEPSQL